MTQHKWVRTIYHHKLLITYFYGTTVFYPLAGTLTSTVLYWMRSMLLTQCLHMNHNFQEKLVNIYMPGWNKTTPILKACILIIRGCPLSRNSPVLLDHLQLFKNENCKIQTRKAWHEVLRNYCVYKSTTETHHPHQNPAKSKIQDLNNNDNHIVERTNIPTSVWIRCIILWPWWWIMLQFPPLVGGHLLSFP